jgi:hypothetical protein
MRLIASSHGKRSIMTKKQRKRINAATKGRGDKINYKPARYILVKPYIPTD